MSSKHNSKRWSLEYFSPFWFLEDLCGGNGQIPWNGIVASLSLSFGPSLDGLGGPKEKVGLGFCPSSLGLPTSANGL